MAQYNCQHCGAAFEARTADRARGWARFCSKSCKAKRQEKRTGQYQAHLAQRDSGFDAGMDGMEEGWDGHKNIF
jgi:hypothetical protein